MCTNANVIGKYDRETKRVDVTRAASNDVETRMGIMLSVLASEGGGRKPEKSLLLKGTSGRG